LSEIHTHSGQTALPVPPKWFCNCARNSRVRIGYLVRRRGLFRTATCLLYISFGRVDATRLQYTPRR